MVETDSYQNSKVPALIGDLNIRILRIVNEFGSIPREVLIKYISMNGFRTPEDRESAVKHQLSYLRATGHIRQNADMDRVQNKYFNEKRLSKTDRSTLQDLELTSWILAAYGEDKIKWISVPDLTYSGMIHFVYEGSSEDIGCDAIAVHIGNINTVQSSLLRIWRESLSYHSQFHDKEDDVKDTYYHIAVITSAYLSETAFLKKLKEMDIFNFVAIVDEDKGTVRIKKISAL